MREILFRGKSTESGKWAFGYLVVLKDLLDDENPTNIIGKDTGYWYQVVPETVGQFTGASEGGKKVFEHDMVRVECEGGEITGVIEFELGAFIIATNDDEDGWRFLVDFIDAEGNLIGEVIGNIHEQKEKG